MSYPVNVLLRAVQAPPIAESQGWAEAWRPRPGQAFLDLAQAVPSEPPAAELREHLAALVRADGAAGYTAILGLAALREALAGHVSERYRARVEPDQVAITAGCNQAFCLAMLALAGPGDEVLLPVPYYFNHQMWLEMLGIRARLLPVPAEQGAVPSVEAAAGRIGSRTRALVLVTPNNPTGAVYPPALLEGFHRLARERGLALVIDETYRDFRAEPGPPHGLLAEPGWEETVVQLYSFSKAYALPGYRVGALIGGRTLLAEVAKVADCVAICAPRIGQEAALYALGHLEAWREARRATMQARVEALRAALAAAPGGYRLVSVGAYFAYLRHPFRGRPAAEVARVLAAEHGLLCLPGSIFGPGQEDYLRLAFANLGAEAMPEVARRLAEGGRALDR